jgi:hypothetical protein
LMKAKTFDSDFQQMSYAILQPSHHFMYIRAKLSHYTGVKCPHSLPFP